MRKNKLLLLLALLLTAATGAWAQTTYSVKMKADVKDAANWSIASGGKSAKGDAADGLTGLSEGDQVTLQYTGRRKVKGVKATSDAAAPSVPDGAISGVFSVSATKKVYFSKGNLQATYNGSNWSWAFAEHQWDYIGNAAGNTSINGGGTISGTGTVDLFGWVGAACEWTGAAQYGISNVKTANQYGNVVGEALKSDWGTLAITNGGNTANFGWHSLASSEWEYLFQTRTTPSGVRYAHATVNDVPGLVLLPDDWSTDYYSLNKVNDANSTAYTDNVISSSDWTSKLEAHGAVFLPAGGYRSGATVSNAGVQGSYWSSTSSTNSGQQALCFFFKSAQFAGVTLGYMRPRGCSVRLVQATSDAEPAVTWNTVDLSTLTADYTAQDGDVLTGTLGGNYKITIADGATVTLSGAVINGTNNESYKWAGLTLAGDGTIILSGENTVKGFYEDCPGIFVPANKTLTIQGDGSLTASSNGYGAGIGGGYNISCGNITIEGGTITATGGRNAAGIGGGYSASCGDISITGGTVSATGGQYAPGIGGGGDGGSCGDITITNTVTKVTATAGTYAPNSIGAGFNGTCGTVTIGGTVGAISDSPYTYQPSN